MTAELGAISAMLGTLPRRYAPLLIDRLLECKPGVSARGLKAVTINEPYFQGHFPGHPVMPGVLVIEALVQLATVLAQASGRGVPGKVVTLDGVRFKRQVIPGDLLILEVSCVDAAYALRALVGAEIAAEAVITLAATAD